MAARRALASIGSSVTLLALVACSSTEEPVDDPSPAPTSAAPSPTETEPVEPEPVEPSVDSTVADGLGVPWSVAFLPDGDALVSQRDEATIVRVGADGDVTEVGTVPGQEVRTGAEGGLLGLAIDPDDETSLYAYLTTASDNRVVRMTYEDDRLADAEVVLDGIPAGPRNHQGGRLLFDDDGSLFVSTGDAGTGDLAQDRSSLAGKILRIDRDGGPAQGNPFDDLVWSYGHRNVQGLALDDDGRLWASEFGAQETDELNLVERGGNHGWPLVEGESDDPDLVAPQATWSTDDASPAGIAIVRGTVVMTALRGERLWTIPIDGDGAGEPEAFLAGEHGRLRDVVVAPDDTLWVTTSNTDGRGTVRDGDDRILRVVP